MIVGAAGASGRGAGSGGGGASCRTAAGTTEAETAAGPVPALVVAVAEKVYVAPFARPVKVNGPVGPLIVAPPGLAVTV